MDYPTRTIHLLQNHKGKIMEYLTLTLLFIAAVASVTATSLMIIYHINYKWLWARDAAWLHGDICKYALLSSLATAVLELYL